MSESSHYTNSVTYSSIHQSLCGQLALTKRAWWQKLLYLNSHNAAQVPNAKLKTSNTKRCRFNLYNKTGGAASRCSVGVRDSYSLQVGFRRVGWHSVPGAQWVSRDWVWKTGAVFQQYHQSIQINWIARTHILPVLEWSIPNNVAFVMKDRSVKVCESLCQVSFHTSQCGKVLVVA